MRLYCSQLCHRPLMRLISVLKNGAFLMQKGHGQKTLLGAPLPGVLPPQLLWLEMLLPRKSTKHGSIEGVAW